jgi:hypothetical protein
LRRAAHYKKAAFMEAARAVFLLKDQRESDAGEGRENHPPEIPYTNKSLPDWLPEIRAKNAGNRPILQACVR